MKNLIAKIKKSIGTDGLLHFFVCCDIAGSLVAFLIVLFYLLITKQPIS